MVNGLATGERVVNPAPARQALHDFFCTVQVKSLNHIAWAIQHREDAYDILQEAMLRLARHYSGQPDEWPKLFQRIVQNLIHDYFRRKKVRSVLFWWQQEVPASNEDGVPFDAAETTATDVQSPTRAHQQDEIAKGLVEALRQLPQRQQQAFMLRAWWGHDVSETAFAMQCSEGSVKTHYSRALQRLRELLGERYDVEI